MTCIFALWALWARTSDPFRVSTGRGPDRQPAGLP
jgi:hypothetical protein